MKLRAGQAGVPDTDFDPPRLRLGKQRREGVRAQRGFDCEVEAVCDRVLFLSRGKVLLEGNPHTLPREHGSATLEDLFIRVAREPLKAVADVAS